ncbi:hypothetical protein L3X38_033535 [Prunus dulcis]|uniref:Uncharacterized protein n=1 Tax=Prunus dulcis TaxID=3755 RepID=A0AAD4VHT1_PRUDU|nr:hypothetical protein L3X38_033535 [Prunus dulcis]
MYSKIESKYCNQSKLPLEFTPVIPSIPLAGLGDTESTRAANPGRSRDTKSIRAANPGTHGPSVPETHEANVKCADKTEGKLDVRRHQHN